MAMQITGYVVEERRFKPVEVAPEEIPAEAVWVDVRDHTVEEAQSLVSQLGLRLEIDESVRKLDIYGKTSARRLATRSFGAGSDEP